jgi:hypothetical protein
MTIAVSDGSGVRTLDSYNVWSVLDSLSYAQRIGASTTACLFHFSPHDCTERGRFVKWFLFDNSVGTPSVIALAKHSELRIIEAGAYKALMIRYA